MSEEKPEEQELPPYKKTIYFLFGFISGMAAALVIVVLLT